MLFNCVMSLVILGQIIIPRSGNLENLDAVSSFYGPGAVSAWLLVSGNTLYLHFRGAGADELSHINILGCVATAFYPILAAFDVFLRFKDHSNDSQYYAALSVCHLASITLSPMMFFISGAKNGMTRRLWSCVLGFCMLPIIFEGAYYWKLRGISPLAQIKLCSNIAFFADLVLLKKRRVTEWLNSRRVNKELAFGSLLFFSLFISFWLAVYNMSRLDWGQDFVRQFVLQKVDGIYPSVQFIVPRTGSSFRDWDQAALLGAALIGIIVLVSGPQIGQPFGPLPA